MIRPPRVALWLHAQSLASEEREAVVGDLVEEFSSRAADDPRAARVWVWAQTGRSLVPNLRRRLLNRRSRAVPEPPRGARMLNGLGTDLRFALRLLKRQPLMSLVAFLSLTAGLALNILLVTIADAALARRPTRDTSCPCTCPADCSAATCWRSPRLAAASPACSCAWCST